MPKEGGYYVSSIEMNRRNVCFFSEYVTLIEESVYIDINLPWFYWVFIPTAHAGPKIVVCAGCFFTHSAERLLISGVPHRHL